VTLLTLLVTSERSVSAASEHRVVLLRSFATDEITTMALARIKGELIAAGFEVTLLAQPEDLSPRNAVETAAPELRPLAVFAIFRERVGPGAASAAEIWVSDRIVGRTSVERMRLDENEPSRDATVLAVRAVELLKASLAEFWVALDRPPPKTRVDRPAVKETLPTMAPRRWPDEGMSTQVAVGILHSFGEIGPVWTPVLAFSYGTASGVGGRMTVGGLGSDAVVEAPAGTGRVEQQFATLDGFITSRWRGPLQIFGSAAVGAYHLQVKGTGAYPYQGKDGQGWSLLTGAGFGMAVEVSPRVALLAEGNGFWAWPPAVVRIADTDVGKDYWPLLLVRTGIGVGF